MQIVEPDELTATLVAASPSTGTRLDEAIAAKATGWTLTRMPVLDLNVLRLGAFELAERPDVPVAVVIDEAVELAKRFSTDDSGRFVNGVLSALVGDLRLRLTLVAVTASRRGRSPARRERRRPGRTTPRSPRADGDDRQADVVETRSVGREIVHRRRPAPSA